MSDRSRDSAYGRAPHIGPVLRPLTWFNAVYHWVATRLLIGGFALLVAVVVVSVFFRYVLNNSLVWGEEAARYLVIWMAFIGAPVAYRRGEHIRVRLALVRMSPRASRVAHVVALLLVVICFSTFVISGLDLVSSNLDRGQRTAALRWQIAWVQLAVPIGSVGVVALAAEALLKGVNEPSELDGASSPARDDAGGPGDGV